MRDYYILDVGSLYRAWRIDNGTPFLLTDKAYYTPSPCINAIKQVKSDDSLTFIPHRYTRAYDLTYIQSHLGECLQCSKEFTYHDAVNESVSSDSVRIVDTGDSSFGEALSVYIGKKLIFRTFGSSKSLELFIKFCLAECGLTELTDYSTLDAADTRKVQIEAAEYGESMLKSIAAITKINANYDQMVYDGAVTAWRIKCNSIVKQLSKEIYCDYINAAAVSLYLVEVTKIVMQGVVKLFHSDNIELVGDLFKRPWVVDIVRQYSNATVAEYNPGLGMYNRFSEAI